MIYEHFSQCCILLNKSQQLLSKITMANKVTLICKKASLIFPPDLESAAVLMAQREVEVLREEEEVLRSAVARLNVELSNLQAKHRPLDPREVKKVI